MRQRRNNRSEVGPVKDFGGIAADVFDSEFVAGAFAYPKAVVLCILEMTQFSSGSEFRMMLVGYLGVGEGRL